MIAKWRIGLYVLLIIIIATIAIWMWSFTQPRDYLVIWGTSGDKCLVAIVDPKTNSVTDSREKPGDCTYAIASPPGFSRIINAPLGEGTLYISDITAQGKIGAERSFALEHTQLTTIPDAITNDLLFLGGIKDNHEQIFEVDLKNGDEKSITASINGMGFSPVQSPDGASVAYLVDKRVENRTQIEGPFECCGDQHYHITFVLTP